MKSRKELVDDYELSPEGDEKLENDRSKGEVVKAIIVRCKAAKAIFAHCVPCQSADEQDYVANKVVEDILWLGYTELILKGDNERSLQSLIDRVLTVVRVRIQQDSPDGTTPDAVPVSEELTDAVQPAEALDMIVSLKLTKISSEKPPAYDSQSNGAVEVGVMLIR